MNQNTQNQVPVPQSLMNALMSYLQPQLQAQAQQGGAAPVQTFPQLQQQPMLQWSQGWQPQGPVGVPGAAHHIPQWMGQPQAMVQHMHPSQQQAVAVPAQPGSLINELAAAVAAAMQPFLQEKNAAPVGSKPDDEKILIEALRKAKSSGLTPRQALEKLHSVNDHTETGWKNYFLDHLEKLYPKVCCEARPSVPYVEIPAVSRSRAGPSSVSTRNNSSRSPSPHTPPVMRQLRPPLPRRQNLPFATENRGRSDVPSSPSSSGRSRRGGPVDDYHAGTHIPPLVANSKPKAPSRDPGNVRFTDDDKIFFIQYLRWRLRQIGPVPSRSDLYAELAKQTPHRDADAWKRHWDDHPQLPDRILIEARNRAGTDSQTPPSSPPAAQDNDSDDEEEDEDEENEDNDGAEPEEAEDATAVRPAARDVPINGQGKKPQRRRVRVTESDVRAMAKYKAERDAVWDDYPSQYACWEEFAKNNTKRSWSAWMNVSIRRAAIIERYAQEYLREIEEGEENQKPRTSPISLGQASTGNSGSASHSQAAVLHTMGRASASQKRPLETRSAERHFSPDQKRFKREEPECIDLTSD